MYTILQSSFVLVVQKVFGGSVNGVRGRRERRRIERMSPKELSAWRTKEFDEIHQRAVRLARLQSDKYLSNTGGRAPTRFASARSSCETTAASRYRSISLTGCDVRGLDLSSVRKGVLIQEHIKRAGGDAETVLPAGVVAPDAWLQSAPRPVPASADTDA